MFFLLLPAVWTALVYMCLFVKNFTKFVDRTKSDQHNSHPGTTRTKRTFSYNDISDKSSFVCWFGPIISSPLIKAQLKKANLKVASPS